MTVFKALAFGGESVDVRCLDLGGSITTRISRADVVCKDDDDVRA
jgi:hypothetical protein